MPRGRRRFSDLERQLDTLILAGAQPAVGTDVYEYFQFKKGINKITMTNAPTAAERVRRLIALYPFNFSLPAAPTADDLLMASITTLSNTGRNSLQITNNQLGYENVPAGNKTPTPEFYPAILRIFNKTTAAPTTPISGILKKEYTRYAGESYSVPFGRSATLMDPAAGETLQTVAEETSRRELAGKVKVANPRASISYSPEEFGSRRAELTPL